MGGPTGRGSAFGGIDRSAFLYGRGADYTGNDNNGKLTVSGTVEGSVGGQTYDGSADNNEVRIDKSFIGRDPRDLSEEEVA